MKLVDLPRGAIEWTSVPCTAQPGETGHALTRSRVLGEIQLRMVEYSPGYLADHWCDKGHILLVTQGAVVLEHCDGVRYELTVGATWHAADNGAAPHRVICEHGATVFIVD
jgi:hypothetical protein